VQFTIELLKHNVLKFIMLIVWLPSFQVLIYLSTFSES